VKQQSPTPQELSDLVSEGISATIEVQESYAKDWTDQLHGENWRRSRTAESGESLVVSKQGNL
jgi:hypothetical protein